jgi:succinate dehydrogenase / fumarate reductase iron-sulfur subunit
MAVCGSCGMRVDGGAALACKTPMKKFVDAGHRITVSPMGNLPVIKDLVVDMAPFWQKIRAVKPYLDTKDVDVPAKEWRVTQEASDQIHKESLCILCGCCVSECNSMESDPEFLGPAALAKAYRFVGDARDQDTRERLRDLNGAHGIWDCTRCYFCNQRCPKHVDPRDAIAKLGAESFKEGFTRDEGAKHAKVFVDSTYKGGYLRETELVPKTIGPISAHDRSTHGTRGSSSSRLPDGPGPKRSSRYGRIASHWKRDGEKLTMDVTIPPNSTGTIFVPAKDASSVTESGKPAGEAEGVKFLRMENNAAVYAVSSGTYQFQSTLNKTLP